MQNGKLPYLYQERFAGQTAIARLYLYLTRIIPGKSKLIMISSLIVIAGIGLTAYSLNYRNLPPAAKSLAPATQADDKEKPAAKVYDVERVTVRPTGFDPPTITRSHQKFHLMIENRTGLEELSFEIKTEAGGKANAKEMKLPGRKLLWRDLVQLPPGNYTIAELNHPEWVFSLNLTPQ